MRYGDFKIGTYLAKNENKFGGNRFSLRFEASKIKYYQIEMLGTNRCSGLLDMFIVHDGDEIEICYEIAGLIQFTLLNEIYTGNFSKALKICANMLKCIKKCEKYLLDSASIPLESDMIFVDPVTDDVFLMFIPSYIRNETIRSSLLRLVSEACAVDNDNVTDVYAWSLLKKGLYEANPGINDMLRLIEELKRETIYSEWTKGEKGHVKDGEKLLEEACFDADLKTTQFTDRISNFCTLVLSRAFNYNSNKSYNNESFKKGADKWKR